MYLPRLDDKQRSQRAAVERAPIPEFDEPVFAQGDLVLIMKVKGQRNSTVSTVHQSSEDPVLFTNSDALAMTNWTSTQPRFPSHALTPWILNRDFHFSPSQIRPLIHPTQCTRAEYLPGQLVRRHRPAVRSKSRPDVPEAFGASAPTARASCTCGDGRAVSRTAASWLQL